MPEILKIGSKGTIQLSRKLRAELDLNEGDELLADVDGETIVLRRKARRFSEYLENLPSRRPR